MCIRDSSPSPPPLRTSPHCVPSLSPPLLPPPPLSLPPCFSLPLFHPLLPSLCSPTLLPLSPAPLPLSLSLVPAYSTSVPDYATTFLACLPHPGSTIRAVSTLHRKHAILSVLYIANTIHMSVPDIAYQARRLVATCVRASAGPSSRLAA
eukprot:3529754-Rhodomonas_salina.1